MKCIICHKETMSGVFVHTPQKRVICIKCRQEQEERQAEIIRKETEK
jgi:hypothetical protein